jgi:hypothetical protein
LTGVNQFDNYSFPRRSSIADANKEETESGFKKEKGNLERSAELSNLGRRATLADVLRRRRTRTALGVGGRGAELSGTTSCP